MASDIELAPVAEYPAEKGAPDLRSAQPADALDNDRDYRGKEVNSQPSGTGRINSYIGAFEKRLLQYNLEARGIQRVHEDERMPKLSWLSYVQACLLWVSINLAANNITLGMLGPVVFGLSFRDASLCAVFGALVGSLIASWMATWGPFSGLRTMVCSYTLGSPTRFYSDNF